MLELRPARGSTASEERAAWIINGTHHVWPLRLLELAGGGRGGEELRRLFTHWCGLTRAAATEAAEQMLAYERGLATYFLDEGPNALADALEDDPLWPWREAHIAVDMIRARFVPGWWHPVARHRIITHDDFRAAPCGVIDPWVVPGERHDHAPDAAAPA